MDLQHITFDPNKFALISELLNVLGFTTNAQKYEWEVDYNLQMEWGSDYASYDNRLSGYIDTTIQLVEDFEIQSEAKKFLSEENFLYIEKHIKSATLYAKYFTSHTYKLSIDYLYDAGTDSEFTIDFEIELSGLSEASKVDAYFEDKDAVNKVITYLILSSS